jgi:hypothetical protein
MWPGFYDVDVTSPGKIWIAAHRRNQSIKAKAAKLAKSQALKRKKINGDGRRNLHSLV